MVRHLIKSLPFSVTIVSVWFEPNLLICSIASWTSSTTSTQHCKSPYSTRNEVAGGGGNGSNAVRRGPAYILTLKSK